MFPQTRLSQNIRQIPKWDELGIHQFISSIVHVGKQKALAHVAAEDQNKRCF